MSKKQKARNETGFDPKMKDLECFQNQPNINMVIPWIYKIYKNMEKPTSRDVNEEPSKEDKIEKDLQCFLNQPNINMTIPWIYKISRSIEDGDMDLRWVDLTDEGEGE